MLKYVKQYAASIEGINIYPLFSLMVFVIFFIAVIYFVKKMDKNRVEEIRNMPLDLHDENNINPIKA
jgi:cbb3-type cytochrome oxidase subunit 3